MTGRDQANEALCVFETSADRAPDGARDCQDDILRPEDRFTDEERALPSILPLNMGSEHSRRAQREAERVARRGKRVA